MIEELEDIRIIGKPDPAKVKVGSKSYTHIFLFPLSSAPPQRWKELLIQEWDCRTMHSPRHIWVNNREMAIDCPGNELALIVERVGIDIEIANRKYRKEVENISKKTELEMRQAEEEKCADAASIKKVIDELKLPGQVSAGELSKI
jgi:hypothetical protein